MNDALAAQAARKRQQCRQCPELALPGRELCERHQRYKRRDKRRARHRRQELGICGRADCTNQAQPGAQLCVVCEAIAKHPQWAPPPPPPPPVEASPSPEPPPPVEASPSPEPPPPVEERRRIIVTAPPPPPAETQPETKETTVPTVPKLPAPFDETAQTIRDRLAECETDKGGRRMIPDQLRQAILGFADSLMATGASQSTAAAACGVAQSLITQWRIAGKKGNALSNRRKPPGSYAVTTKAAAPAPKAALPAKVNGHATTAAPTSEIALLRDFARKVEALLSVDAMGVIEPHVALNGIRLALAQARPEE